MYDPNTDPLKGRDISIADHDGKTHINVWSRAKTELGRALSNFTYAPFTHPEFGRFASVEGFWYWLAAGHNPAHDVLRTLYGFSAKMTGAALENIPQDDAYFQEQICKAIEAKILQNPDLLEMFLGSELPFTHYFVMGEKDYRQDGQYRRWIVRKARHQWQMDFLMGLRERLGSVSKLSRVNGMGGID